ncbi:hypothetical protein J7E50_24730 [Pedobacter sp. ISL-68]|uniref:hypothetical protein n=1 Tax=Pedobacter sp. ISL-64 TaxID=2819164 RepID=UPI001BEA52E4|nr:hypothetical protein [Pedobacter sp. ISL-64]MBT2563112.1 hypothetical protein [Pedobacter sp. ISL-64]MBT2593450.1 hypothetical protein [Pedobacter sp. ISL-68]
MFEHYMAGRSTPTKVKQLMQYFYADENGQLDRLICTELEGPEERNVSCNVFSVSAEDIERQPATNPLLGLTGRCSC